MNPPGISVASKTPLWLNWSSSWDLTAQLRDYQHVIQALGGYWSARFTIRGGRDLVDDWLQDGLGRHIQTFDGALVCCWEGFVNKITVNYGPLAATRGPLLDIANRVALIYSTIERDEDDNPIVGTRAITDNVNDTDSQDAWGIVPKLLSTGGAELLDAEAIRDTYMEGHKLPRTGKDFRSDSETETSVTVECLGYVHWLNWAYRSLGTGTLNASVKISNVLADTPNVAWLAYDTANVTANTLQVPAWDDNYNIAWSVIKDIAARGDASQNRWLFGIYTDLEVYYEVAPTIVEYQQPLSQAKSMVERADGDEVYPWSMRPGKWMLFPDFLIGQASELNLRDDQRAMFIEQVKFISPNTLELKGGDTDTLGQLVAQLGLGGIGA